MSLDEDVSPIVRHQREQDAAAEREWREQQAQDEYERDGGQWRSIFRQQAAEMPEVHYSDRADRRLFAIDGDLVEQARRDAEQPQMPGGWVA